MFDKRYQQVHRSFFTVKHFPNSVDAAMPNKAPETGGWSGCVALACVGVCVVRPFPGGRLSHAARRAGRDRGASGRACAGSYNIQKPMTDSKVGWCSVL